MAGKKQPGLIDMVSILLEEMEKNRESTKDLFDVADILNSKMDSLKNHNPKLNIDSLKVELDKFQNQSNLNKNEMIKLVYNHIESLKRHQLEISQIKPPETLSWYLDLKVWMIIFLSFYSIYISYLLYQSNTNLSTLIEQRTTLNNK
ncbi:hypothetical protein [Flavobacterium proteolyticum]|uniref:Uncharacterized protein n=1 Tax=Flavobacterium proteolyticum TaxID=2911683 RepID=A0ABR9WUT9_9FLAO|nr:hypothetical protein [Flavobacterium proteolyticum]MBE9577425.1 hypothetical protein [Flavobacterium proteolyticum]